MTTYISLGFSIASPNTTLTLPIFGFIGTIDWGNGVVNTYTVSTTNPFLTYVNSGNYTVNIQNVTQLQHFSNVNNLQIYSSSLTNFSYLIQIPSLTDFTFCFQRCSRNFTINFATNVTSNVNNMEGMFMQASAFNQPVNFNTSNVNNMSIMFMQASAFNQPVNFNTSNVTNMFGMFAQALAFNQPVNFNTSNVTGMESMFDNARSFNQPVNFNTSKVTNMVNMFAGASAFNQPVILTPIPNLTNVGDFGFFKNSGISIANYSNLLILWGSQPTLKPNVTFNAGSVKYNLAAQQYRNILTSRTNNWFIYDGGLSSGPLPAITNVSPTSGNSTTLVTISGTNLNYNTVVTFNSQAATIVSITNSQITCYPPYINTIGNINLTVTTNYGLATTSFNYGFPPVITNVSPTSGNSNTLVTIVGTYLNYNTVVQFDSQAATIVSINNSSITCYPPILNVNGNVALTVTTTYGEASSTFNYVRPPTILSVDPSSGNSNDLITIVGTNLDYNTVVKFNSQNANIVSINNSTITCYPPVINIYGNVPLTVTTDYGVASTTFFNNLIPTVIDVYPTQSKIYGDASFQYYWSSNNPSNPTFSSSDTTVATINSTGIITLLNPGSEAKTTTITISQAVSGGYSDGSANTVLTVDPNNPSNPTVVTNGQELEYFMTTNATNVLIQSNLELTQDLVNGGNEPKVLINTSSTNVIYKI